MRFLTGRRGTLFQTHKGLSVNSRMYRLPQALYYQNAVCETCPLQPPVCTDGDNRTGYLALFWPCGIVHFCGSHKLVPNRPPPPNSTRSSQCLHPLGQRNDWEPGKIRVAWMVVTQRLLCCPQSHSQVSNNKQAEVVQSGLLVAVTEPVPCGTLEPNPTATATMSGGSGFASNRKFRTAVLVLLIVGLVGSAGSLLESR